MKNIHGDCWKFRSSPLADSDLIDHHRQKTSLLLSPILGIIVDEYNLLGILPKQEH